MKKRIFTVSILGALFLFMSNLANAQVTNTDSNTDPYYDYYSDSPDSASDDASANVNSTAAVKKEYVRVVLPFDTITELVTYSEVIGQNESDGDSLYIRAKRWLTGKFGKNLKSITVEEKANEKIILKPSFDLYMSPNKFVQSKNGTVRFTMAIRFKDGKYKYVINNLVHEQPSNEVNKKPSITYFEFYRVNQVNVKNTDKVLLAADKELNKLIASLKKALQEPNYVDEDEW